MNHRSSLFLLSIALAVVMIVSACGTAAPATTQPPDSGNSAATEPPAATQAPAATAEKTTINVISFLTYDANIEGAENKVVAAFEAAHPEIDVNFQLLAYADYFNTLKTWIQGGTAPDVASLDIDMAVEAAMNGALAELDPLISADNYDLSPYYPSTLDMFKVNGKMYGLPATFSDVVMFYNKNLFDAAGLPYPTDTMDWNTYIETAKKLSKDTNGDGAIDVFGTARAWWPLYLMMNDAAVYSGTQCTLTDQAAIDGVQALVNLSYPDNTKIAPTADDLAVQDDWHMFEAQKIAMYPIGPWAVNPFNTEITDFGWDAAQLPSGPGGNKATFLFGNAYSILAGSKQQQAAFEFVKFATGPEGDQIRQDAGFEIAANQSVSSNTFLKALEGKSPANAKVFLDSAAFAQTVPTRVVPPNARASEIKDAVQAQLDLALLGSVSVSDAMKSACDTINPILAGD